MQLEKPDLYTLGPDGQGLSLRADRCEACGTLNFPRSPYGCPACGAETGSLREEAMPGRAELLTFITIHQRLAPGIEPPCVVGEARLANGSIQEVMLEGAEDRFADEMAIEAVPVTVTRDGAELIACRFAPAAEART